MKKKNRKMFKGGEKESYQHVKNYKDKRVFS
jgi:hypothetical protein